MRNFTTIQWKQSNKCIILFSFSIFIFLSNILYSQEAHNYNFDELSGLFQVNEKEKPRYKSTKTKPYNEIEFLMAISFNTYKSFFSSQDNPSCIFHPSCSEYSVLAFQQKGLFLGALYTFDRLSRCHQFIKSEQYFYNPAKNRFYDPLK